MWLREVTDMGVINPGPTHMQDTIFVLAASSAQNTFSGNLAKINMPTSAQDSQVVLNLVKAWYMQSFRDQKVYGCFAIEDDHHHRPIQYTAAYCSKSCIYTRFERQLRGTLHLHCLVWYQNEEDEASH